MKETLYGIPFYVIIKKSSPETHAIYVNYHEAKDFVASRKLKA